MARVNIKPVPGKRFVLETDPRVALERPLQVEDTEYVRRAIRRGCVSTATDAEVAAVNADEPKPSDKSKKGAE